LIEYGVQSAGSDVQYTFPFFVNELVASANPGTDSRSAHAPVAPFQYSQAIAPAATPAPRVDSVTLRPRKRESAPKVRYRPRRVVASTPPRLSGELLAVSARYSLAPVSPP
jgi:hypothetical protein